MKQDNPIYDSLPDKFNFAHFLYEQMNATRKEKIAFICDDQQLSYGELFHLMQQQANVLRLKGIAPGDRVGLLQSDSIDFVVNFLATLWLGAVSVIINEAFSLDDIHYILEDSRPDLIIANSNWCRQCEALSFRPTFLRSDTSLIDTLADQATIDSPTFVQANSHAFWVYTSGSTGKPKGVMHSHYNPVVAIENYGKSILRLKESDTVYSAPPMSFSYGLGTSLYFPLYAGATVILSKESSPFVHIDLLNRHQVTVFFGIPHTYASIIALADIQPLNSQALRLCICAGEQLAIDLWQRWRDVYNIELCEGIGTTESTHIFISNQPGKSVPGSTGKAVSGYEIVLIKEDGSVAAVDEPGILEVHGEGFMLGYWQKASETSKVLSAKRMRTGDLYRKDKDDNYYFLGRNDALLKVKGMWVLPSEIEQVLSSHPSVQEVAVLVTPGVIDNTVQIEAFFTANEVTHDEMSLKKSLQSFAKSRLAKYKAPKKIHLIEHFPRTATGKINRRALSSMEQGNAHATEKS